MWITLSRGQYMVEQLTLVFRIVKGAIENLQRACHIERVVVWI